MIHNPASNINAVFFFFPILCYLLVIINNKIHANTFDCRMMSTQGKELQSFDFGVISVLPSIVSSWDRVPG